MAPAEVVRSQTVRRLPELGFPEPPVHFPLIADSEKPFTLRPETEVVERLLVLNVRVGLAFGMPHEHAQTWLADNDLTHCVSEAEAELVRGPASVNPQEQIQVESMWALAWALSLTEELVPSAYCGDELVTLVPNLRVAESVQSWRSRQPPRLRRADEVLAELDLLYAMTWGAVDARLTGKPRPGVLDEYVYWERRRALEFTRAEHEISHASWDTIDLST